MPLEFSGCPYHKDRLHTVLGSKDVTCINTWICFLFFLVIKSDQLPTMNQMPNHQKRQEHIKVFFGAVFLGANLKWLAVFCRTFNVLGLFLVSKRTYKHLLK
jgi:hypothetical protein